MSWSQLSVGFLVFIVAGLLIACAVYEGSVSVWTTGILVVLLGALTTLAAFLRPRRRGVEPESTAGWNEAAAPRLGQMLVDYGLVTEADLSRALARQSETKNRLAQTLVEMGLVTHAQVAEVLEEQLSRREGRLLWGVGEKMVE